MLQYGHVFAAVALRSDSHAVVAEPCEHAGEGIHDATLVAQSGGDGGANSWRKVILCQPRKVSAKNMQVRSAIDRRSLFGPGQTLLTVIGQRHTGQIDFADADGAQLA